MQSVLFSCLFCQRQQLFFRFPSIHLGRIVHGLCFSWVNDSSIRYIFEVNELWPWPVAQVCPHLKYRLLIGIFWT